MKVEHTLQGSNEKTQREINVGYCRISGANLSLDFADSHRAQAREGVAEQSFAVALTLLIRCYSRELQLTILFGCVNMNANEGLGRPRIA